MSTGVVCSHVTGQRGKGQWSCGACGRHKHYIPLGCAAIGVLLRSCEVMAPHHGRTVGALVDRVVERHD